MKLRIVGIVSFLVGFSFFLIGCPGTKSPTAPPPTNTPVNTPCVNASQTPCTSTFTYTQTNTSTVTNTFTATNTPTATLTPTWTGTPTQTSTITNTLTQTWTGTPTNSPTDTLSPTPTLSPTATGTPTITNTPTNTGTPTSSYTSSPTQQFSSTRTATVTKTATTANTSTSTLTPTPTFDPYVITGTVQYTGGASLAGKYLLTMATTCLNCNNGPNIPWSTAATSSAVSYTLNLPSTGSYVVIAMLSNQPTMKDEAPPVGAPYGFYGPATVCMGGKPSTITVSGPSTQSANVTFGNTCVFDGISGAVTYTGVGVVNSNAALNVVAYTDSGYVTMLGGGANAYVTINGGAYNLINSGGLTTVYLQAFYGVNQGNQGNNNAPVTGDPVTNLGPVTFNTSTTTKAITLTDAFLYNSTYSLSGTVNWTGSGSVNASNPIVVRAVTCTSPNNNCNTIGACQVNSNGGTYFFGLPSGGSYYLSEEYLAVPGMQWSTGQSTLGGYDQNSDGTCFGNAGAILVAGSAVTSLSFDNGCGQNYGYTGTLTYNGGMGTPSCNGSTQQQIWVQAADGNSESANGVGNTSGVCDNGDSYNVVSGSSSQSLYLRVWFDSTGHGCCQPVSGDPWTVVGPNNSGTNPSPINITFGDGNTW